MGLFDKLFGKKQPLTTENINEKLNIGEYFYLMSYNEHYSEFLSGIDNKNKVIAELFVFRAWTTQFGFRLFSSQPEVSEEIIGQVFNQGKLGKGMLNQLEQVDIEVETNREYVDLMDSRWQDYDSVFIENKNSETPIPTRQICGKLTDFCDIHDPMKFIWLCTDFIKQLDNIKQEALKTGLLK
ncbi:MAG: hypothetical protein H6600_03070 [Flavobacteriales bacterium]|nr:hypothetical protein [Flavobacteriales bacterium]